MSKPTASARSKSTEDPLCRAVKGDREALGILLRRHGPTVRQTVAGKIPSRWRSVLSEDDVMQQTYADAVRAISSLNSRREAALVAWLHKTAKRNLLQAVRMLEAEKRGGLWRPLVSADKDASHVDLFEAMSGTGKTPSSAAAAREAQSALKTAIAGLPKAYARVITLYDLEGKPLQDVSQSLKRSPGAVLMLRARAHERLKESMRTSGRWLSSG